jgi:large subunit ribosomal protein L22
MGYKYAFENYNKELMSRAVGNSLGISTKQSIEICNAIRCKSIVRAKTILEEAISEKKAIPFRRFNKDMGHKKKIGPGRYPVKACTEILNLIKSAESNAQFKGLNTSNMIIKHICAHQASRPYHHGRQRGVKMKRTHVEIVLEETKTEKKTEKIVKKTKESKSKTEKKQEKVEVIKKEKIETKTDESSKKVEEKKEDKPEVKKVETKKEIQEEVKQENHEDSQK